MDPNFESRLLEGGVGEDVLKVLKQEKVVSHRVFQAMKEDHIVRLLQCSGMTVGGHALLWELWERDSSPCSRPNRKFFLQHCITVLHVALLRKQRRYSSTRSITIFCVVVFIFSSYV